MKNIVFDLGGVPHPHPNPPLEGEGTSQTKRENSLPFKGRVRVGMGNITELKTISIS
jgi:hypothetical protein